MYQVRSIPGRITGSSEVFLGCTDFLQAFI
jgi:hypothetical protein